MSHCGTIHLRASLYRSLGILLLLACAVPGCANSDWVKVRAKPAVPLAAELQLFSWRGPQPTPRTLEWLRRHDLNRQLKDDPHALLNELLEIVSVQPSPENVFAVAELSYIGGQRAQDEHQLGEALDLYGVSVAHAYPA